MYPVTTMCRLLNVSTSGYDAWLKRRPWAHARRDAEHRRSIRRIHSASYGNYGVPRIRAELVAEGTRIGLKRVARMMCAEGLMGVSRRRGTRTTIRSKRARPAPDLVDRGFSAEGTDRLWVADITYIPMWLGFLFLAVVLDAWSRRIVGWSMATHLRTELGARRARDGASAVSARRRHPPLRPGIPKARFKASSQHWLVSGFV